MRRSPALAPIASSRRGLRRAARAISSARWSTSRRRTLADGGVIRPEADPELAECVALRTDARSRLAALEERERERTGIKALKVKYASAFGYAIEIGKSNAGSVPADYVRKQTLTNGERYVTPELKELELAISTAQARQLRLERQLFDALVERVAARVDDLLARGRRARASRRARRARAVRRRARLRAAGVRRRKLAIEIVDGRHPVMEAMLGDASSPTICSCATPITASSC